MKDNNRMTRNSRRRSGRRMLLSAAAAAAAAGLVLVAAGCGSSSKSSAGSSAGSSQATQNVRLLSYASSSLGWIGYVAQKNGYFAANHLNVSLVVLPAGAQATNALVGGALDVAELDPNNMAPLLAQGQQFKLLLGEQRTFWEMLVSGNLANDTLSQVMQSVTSIGAPSVGGSGGRLAQYMALAYGRSASSLSVVADPVGTALLGGHISALMADPQTGCVLQTQGPKELFDFLTPPADQSGLPAQVRSLFGSAEFGYWASTSWTNGHPQAVKDLQAALTQAINWASSPANLAALTTLLRSTPYNSSSLNQTQFQACVKQIAAGFSPDFTQQDAKTWSNVEKALGLAPNGLPPTSQWFAPGLPQ